MLIHIKRNAEVFGPYSPEEVRQYLSGGRLVLSDFAQLPGTTEWIPLASVPGVRSAPPPPPATALPPPLIAQPAGPQQQARASGVRPGSVLRDVIIIFALSSIGGVIMHFANKGQVQDPAQIMMTVAVSNTLLCTVGFIISGCLATGNRWLHLAYVALGAWAASIINVLLFGFGVEQWMLGAFWMAIMMGMGGGLS